MKFLLSSLLFLGTFFCLQAQTSTSETGISRFNFQQSNDGLIASNSTYNHTFTKLLDDNKIYYETKLKKARKQKKVGIILTSIGAAGLVASITAAVVVAQTEPADVSSSSTGIFVTGKPVAIGVGGTFASLAFLGPGIPFWIIGQHKIKKYKNKV